MSGQLADDTRIARDLDALRIKRGTHIVGTIGLELPDDREYLWIEIVEVDCRVDVKLWLQHIRRDHLGGNFIDRRTKFGHTIDGDRNTGRIFMSAEGDDFILTPLDGGVNIESHDRAGA